MKSSSFVKAVIAVAVLAAAPVVATAQGPRSGAVEVSAGGGYDYLNNGEKEHHGIVGASVSYNVVRAVSVGFEYTFSPLESENIGGVNATEHLHNYGGVARFALLPNRVMVPYIVAAGGGVQVKDQASQGNQSVSLTESGAYVGVGGGVNFYLGHNFGVRPEVRYQRQHLNDTNYQGIVITGSGRNQGVATVSIFYQFGGHKK